MYTKNASLVSQAEQGILSESNYTHSARSRHTGEGVFAEAFPECTASARAIPSEDMSTSRALKIDRVQ